MTTSAWVRGSLLLALTFAGGVAMGVAYDRRRQPSHDSTSGSSQHILRHLSEELALDSAQQKAVAAIFARRQRAVDSTWHTLQPQVRATLDSTLQDIVGVLRPDQLEKYRRMIASRHPGALR